MTRRSEKLPAIYLFMDEPVDAEIWEGFCGKLSRASKAEYHRMLLRVGQMCITGKINAGPGGTSAAVLAAAGGTVAVVTPRRARVAAVPAPARKAPETVAVVESVAPVSEVMHPVSQQKAASVGGLTPVVNAKDLFNSLGGRRQNGSNS